MSFPSQPPPMAGVVHIDVRAADCRWHVATAGPEDAPPIVLVHGWPQHWWAWRKVIPALAKEHRVYAPDLRGFGWSDAPPADYGKHALADDLLLLLDALELERCTLVGHDWGGLTSWNAALKDPDRFERLFVMSISNPWELPPPTPKLIGMAAGYQLPLIQPLARTAVHPRIVRTVLRFGIGPDHRWTDEDIRLYAGQYTRPAHADAAAGIYRSFVTRELPKLRRGRYATADRLDIPATVLAGTADDFTGPHTAFRGLERHVPDVTTVAVEGSGHFVPEEKPQQLLDAILGT